ncbi:hypothetical protein N0V86_003354 [Didymella sp. IMI 355093]|nr:hypothetical protein N0V86_003354 [Didymella sp. IMI 355093]
MAELGASLETYSELLPNVQTLRLCCRFGNGPLSAAPQEIFDLIIKALYRSVKNETLPKWNSQFMCFQDDYDIEEKRKMVAEYIDVDDGIFLDTIWNEHDKGRDRWLDMVCLCKDTGQSTDKKTFTHLQKILKSSFGLEATILHELLSERMRSFFSDAQGLPSPSYYTSCFLTLPTYPVTDVKPRSRTEPHANPAFLQHGNHSAYHQKVNLANLQISEKRISSFTRALHILDLQPVLHLTELEPSLVPSTDDPTLSTISDLQLKGWPEIPAAPIDKKKLRLERLLEGKNEEVSKQKWPQFMVMAASNTVSPRNY